MSKLTFNFFFDRVFIAIRFVQLISKLLINVCHFNAFIFSLNLKVVCESMLLSL